MDPNASSPAGGTATICVAITLSPKHRKVPSSGSIAIIATASMTANGFCMGCSREQRGPKGGEQLRIATRGRHVDLPTIMVKQGGRGSREQRGPKGGEQMRIATRGRREQVTSN